MLTPDKAEFERLAKHGNIIPVYRTLMADTITPVLAFSKVAKRDHAFLLESVVGGENIGRYSFMGADPAAIFRSRDKRIELTGFAGPGTRSDREHPCPLDRLAELMAEYKAVPVPGLPRFSGGCVGYFAYDVVRQVERLPNAPADTLGLPDMYFGFYHSMIVFDHVNRTLKVVAHADLRLDSANVAYAKAEAEIERLVAMLRAPGEVPVEEAPAIPASDPEFESNFTPEGFKKMVADSQEYIRAGDIFQVVLSQRFKMPCLASPFSVYRTLRTINPAPYMFCLKYPEMALVGSSPEVMTRVEDGKITVRPIAGTRRRGATPAEDAALEEELLADEKELAEHAMLVDLGRNDVGRVSEYGSVKLTESLVIERYSHVMHIVSNVEGKLRQGLSALDALKACLPAGTVSGAPKVRAMEIIDRYEPTRRCAYAGAVGYLDFNGNMDTCITLRTVLLKGGSAYVQAGGGIVYDSVPEGEYQESRNKARALLRAVAAANASGLGG